MVKHLSTVGIVLMTALVVYRASTIDHSIELDGIYQRNADVSFITENNDRLQTITMAQFGNELLVFNTKLPVDKIEHKSLKKIRPKNQVILPLEIPQGLITTEEPLVTVYMDENETRTSIIAEGFSLGSESTINSNLSLLFPGQRILQHPSVSELSE